MSAIDTAAAKSAAGLGDFFAQHSALLITWAAADGRLMSGFLAGTLFNEQLVQSKSAYHSPIEPAAAPVPAASGAAAK
jgi:hypothetical protein